MRHYEIVLIVHPDRSEQIPNMLKRYQAMITDQGGAIDRLEDWGRRPLAYGIRKVHKGHYILMNIACDGNILSELEHMFKFNDAILRHLIVQVKEAISEPSVMLKDKDSEKIKNLLVVEPTAQVNSDINATTEEVPQSVVNTQALEEQKADASVTDPLVQNA